MSWDQPMRRYSTASIRTQLGAVRPRQPLSHRGLLALSPRSTWQSFFPDIEIPSSINIGMPLSDIERAFFSRAEDAWIFPRAIASSLINPHSGDSTPEHRNQSADFGVILSRYPLQNAFNAHAAHASLFQDTLNQTQSPAVALQALLTRICQMIYYETLLPLNETDRAENAFSHAAVIPTQWTGFGVGMGLLLSHWVVAAIVVGLFARYTRHSLLGNHWQAVAQVYSKDTMAVLGKADQMNDEEVKRWVKGKGHGRKLYSVTHDEGEGRVALTVKHD